VSDSAPGTTRIVARPDGGETLLLQKARVSVLEGPDRGAILVVEQPRVVVGSGSECDLVLTDPAVSRLHAELRATDRGYALKDLGSTNGTFAGGLRVVEVLLGAPTTLTLGETEIRVSPTTETVEIPLSSRGSFGGLLGQSLAMRRLFAVLERVAPTRSTILLEGESGTGKEVAAQAIHEASPRREGPLVVVDCGSIPQNLVESELFGHEKGAFTGAHERRAGAFEEADGGTLFLDEIGELPLAMQPRLLRFLETQEVKRVGAAQHRRVDVRVVAATHRKLAAEVKRGSFRQDLFYRLSVVQVPIAPLRERPEDIRLLAHHFAARFAEDPAAVVTEEIAALLCAYHWPGNVRELRNTVERLALLPEHGRAHLEARIDPDGGASIGSLAGLPFHVARKRWQDTFERQYLSALMARAGGVVTTAAGLAELPRQTFHRLLARHGLRGGDR
jgi:DNA-binding NtrC family response regulator